MTDLEEKTKQLKKKIGSSVLSKEWLERTIISLGLYGKISGVLGPYIIANVNGKMIIRLRPKDFKMSQTEASIANRKNMAAATKFALFLKSIDPIYETWKRAKIKGNNAFTRLIKYNKMHLVSDCPSNNNMITPEGNTIYLENSISVDKNAKIEVSRDYLCNENEQLVIVIIALNPKKKGSPDFECIEVNNSPVVAGQNIELKDWQKKLCRNYKRFIMYSAVLRHNGKKIQWSNTCVQEAQFDFGVDFSLAESCGYGQIKSSVYYGELSLHSECSINAYGKLVNKPPG